MHKTTSTLLIGAVTLGAFTSIGFAQAVWDLRSPQPGTPAWSDVNTWARVSDGATGTPGTNDTITIDNTGTNALVLSGTATANVIVNGTYTIAALNVTTVGSGINYNFYRSSAASLTVTGALTKQNSSQLTFGRNGDATFTLNLNGGVNLDRGTLRFANNVAPTITGTIGMNADVLSVYATLVTNANHTFGNGVSLTGAGSGDAGSRAVFQPASGTTLTLNGAISQTSATFGRNLAMDGAGTLALGGVNTYFGNTIVSNANGTLNLLNGGETRFVIGANGVSNSISGTGSANFNGMFRVDLSGANLTDGNSWTLVNVGTLSETFGLSFSVASTTLGDFSNDAGIWSLTDGNNLWSFSQSTGTLSLQVIPEPSSFAALAGLSMLGFAASRRRRR